MTESVYSFRPSYEREQIRVDRAPISEHNKEIIRRYHAYMYARGVSENRVVKLSWQLRNVAELMGKDLDEAEASDVQAVMLKINTKFCTTRYKKDQKYKASTKADYGRMLKQFYKWLRNTDTPPPEVKWIKLRMSPKDSKLNIDLMDWNDIELVSQKANTPRDRAFVNFLYESGGRIGEVLAMKIKDVVFKERYAKVRLDGKTGERWVPIVTCVPLLAAYLNTHPDRLNQDASFWLCGANKTLHDPLKYAGAVMILRRLYRAAGIKKRCNPHAFRHSRATELCKKMTESQLRLYFGWERGSDTPAVYTHLSGRDIDAAVLDIYGIKHDDQEQKDLPLNCGLCKTVNNPKAHFCTQCGYALSAEIVIHAEERRKDEMEKTINYMYEMMKNPELMKKFEEFKAMDK